MIEKVNPMHPDKIADRIAGAIVDIAYRLQANPKIAVEVLIGHGHATIITETSVKIPIREVERAVERIAGIEDVKYIETAQDYNLAFNQRKEIRAGDNGIFRGVPISQIVKDSAKMARTIYERFPTDGKYILTDDRIIVCQSNAKESELKNFVEGVAKDLFEGQNKEIITNPLGSWTGGTNVDTGATNRKLGSDMGEAVTGGGLHGKDLSKADVSVNIYAHIKAQEEGRIVEIACAIGDNTIDGKPYHEIVDIARNYIEATGGFEKFAEWGLIQ